MHNVYIINIGSELTKGEVVNTNATYISQKLSNMGLNISYVIAVPDQYEIAIRHINKIVSDEGIYIFTGGLGGTQDDITRRIISKLLKRNLIIDIEKEKALEDWYHKNARSFDESDRMQASYPEGGYLLDNKIGLAYGFYLKDKEKYIFSLPGVPKEMIYMFDEEVLPIIKKEKLHNVKYKSEIITFYNIPEYILDKKLHKILSKYNGIQYGTRTNYGSIRVRIESENSDLKTCINEIKDKLNDYFVGLGERRIEEMIGDMLKNKKLTLSTAESCTAGLLSKVITDVPGSSEYFIGGVVSYSNNIKMNMLDVKKETLQRYGAVSSFTAKEMAIGVLNRMQSDIALSITGVAGPSGGTEEKKVGTVYICLCFKNKKPIVNKNHFNGVRDSIRLRSVNAALFMLYSFLRKGGY